MLESASDCTDQPCELPQLCSQRHSATQSLNRVPIGGYCLRRPPENRPCCVICDTSARVRLLLHGIP